MIVRRSAASPRRLGAAAAELAMILPLLLTIALACVDLGRFAHSSIALSNAVRIGAEWGAGRTVTSFTQPDWEAQVVTEVKNEMAQLDGVDLAKLTVEVESVDEGNKLRRTEVEATYPFDTIVNWPAFPHQIQMRRRHAMHQMR
jgi:Flp pilus assembly protein TadG